MTELSSMLVESRRRHRDIKISGHTAKFAQALRAEPARQHCQTWGRPRAAGCKPRRITWLRRIGGPFVALHAGRSSSGRRCHSGGNVAAGRLGSVSDRKFQEETVFGAPQIFHRLASGGHFLWEICLFVQSSGRFAVRAKNLFLY